MHFELIFFVFSNKNVLSIKKVFCLMMMLHVNIFHPSRFLLLRNLQFLWSPSFSPTIICHSGCSRLCTVVLAIRYLHNVCQLYVHFFPLRVAPFALNRQFNFHFINGVCVDLVENLTFANRWQCFFFHIGDFQRSKYFLFSFCINWRPCCLFTSVVFWSNCHEFHKRQSAIHEKRVKLSN